LPESIENMNKLIKFYHDYKHIIHIMAIMILISTALVLLQPVFLKWILQNPDLANDYSYGQIFSRQIEALGKQGDIAIGISTSGKSVNVNLALIQANEQKLITIDFPRKGSSTPEIQENQLKLMHEVCKIVEEAFI